MANGDLSLFFFESGENLMITESTTNNEKIAGYEDCKESTKICSSENEEIIPHKEAKNQKKTN